MKLAEKTAIVTGAGRNIGEEIAVLFAQEGAKVAVVDMDKSRAKAVADRPDRRGGDWRKGDGRSTVARACRRLWRVARTNAVMLGCNIPSCDSQGEGNS